MYNMFMSNKPKTAKQIQRHIKGISNHHRIDILFTIAEHPKITLEEIVKMLEANKKMIGEHA